MRLVYLARMIRRAIVFVLLTSMTLHCASRLGLVDHLYQRRHQIAFSLGLIAEMPITLCNADTYNGTDLLVQLGDQESEIPQALAQAKAIDLFCTASWQIPNPKQLLLHTENGVSGTDLYAYQFRTSFFRPPSV